MLYFKYPQVSQVSTIFAVREYLEQVLVDRLLEDSVYIEVRMINVMRLARRLGRVVDMVLETVAEAEVLGYMEMEYTVRRMVEDMVMDNLGMMMNVLQVQDLVDVETFW